MSFDPMSFDPMSFDPMSFDPMSFDPIPFDPMSVNLLNKKDLKLFWKIKMSYLKHIQISKKNELYVLVR